VLIIRTTFDLSSDREPGVRKIAAILRYGWRVDVVGAFMRDGRKWSASCVDKGGRHCGNLLFFEQIMFFP